MPVLSIIVGLVLGFGAAQELVVRGIRDGLLQPALLGTAGVVASVLLIAAGIAGRRGSPNQRRLAIAAAILTIAVHAYGVLPPHHNVGVFTALLATVFGLALLAFAVTRKAQPAGSH